MDTVIVFNTELSGLYVTRPPISKAKMAAITKSAMKAIKFYKHVVQSVEKFILKCKAEYKVPGLYVIDSIVRQSRHQFGAEKDVFAPRFARNMQSTFVNLFRCAPEDKSRIIRVLNLWQKNSVFAPEVIQPLFDLANPNHPLHQSQPGQPDEGASNGGGGGGGGSGGGGVLNLSGGSNSNNMMGQDSPPANMQDDGHTMSSDMSGPTSSASTNQMEPSTLRQLQQLQHLLSRQSGASADEPTAGTSGVLPGAPPSGSSALLATTTTSSSSGGSSNAPVSHPHSAAAGHFASKQLLDFEYGGAAGHDNLHHHNQMDDGATMLLGHGNSDSTSISQLLNNPTVLRQLQTLQKLKQQEEKQSKLTEMRLQEEAFEKHLATVLKKLPFANECDLSGGASSVAEQAQQMFGIQSAAQLTSMLQHQQQAQIHQQMHLQQQQQQQQLQLQQQQQQQLQQQQLGSDNMQLDPEVELVSDDGKVEVINLDGNSRSPSPAAERNNDRYSKRRRSRSRSRDRGGRRRRSRSRSRSPRSRRRGGGSRDRGAKDKEKDREREKDREHDRERRRKGLPELKKEHLSVCSTTLWVGHLSKLVHQEELSDTFGKYGDIVSIDMIHPRGCAFIVMNRRQDAYKAMGGLKNHKMQGRAITISWAAGKGVKSKEWKDYWDLELGVSYVPWPKLSASTDFESLEEGGMFDEESMPVWLRDRNKPGAQLNAPDAPVLPAGLLFSHADTTQPPPGSGPPPPMMPPIVNPFTLSTVQRLINPMAMHMPPNLVAGLPLGVPPPQMMMQMPPMPLDKSIPPPTASAPPGFLNHHFPPMPPQLPPILPPPSMSTAVDDHMDLEMDDEPKPPPMMGLFNRPPPQMFGGPAGASGAPPPPFGAPGRDRDGSRGDQRRDRSGSRERRGSRDREFRRDDRDGGGRGGRGDDRRNNNSEFSGRGGNSSRWGGDREDRARSRDLDQAPRGGGGRQADGGHERNSRDKPLHDRLRDMASDGNGMGALADGPPQQWRDVSGPPGPPGNFNPMNFMEQGARGIRPMQMQMGGGPPGNFRGGNDFDFNNRDFDRRGGPPPFVGNGNPFGPGPRGGPMGGRGGPPPMPFGPHGGGPGPMFMRGPRPGGFNDRPPPFFDGPPDRSGGFDRGGEGSGRGGGRLSRGPPGSDRERGGRGAGWNDRDLDNRPKSQDRAQDDKDSKRSGSRWAVTESASPTVVSDEEDWGDEDVVAPAQTKKPDALVPLPQTEPIDDDSQEEDFNDFEEDAAEGKGRSPNAEHIPVAIVEIGDDDSSSSVEELIGDGTVDGEINHGSATAARDDDEAAATPLYDEPENKDKASMERRQSQDDRVAERDEEQEGDEHSQVDGYSHGDHRQSNQQPDNQEELDNVSEDHEQSNHSDERCDDVVSNGDVGETRSEDHSDDERTSRHDDNDDEDHHGGGGDRDEDEQRCPTPDAHIDSDNDETDYGVAHADNANDEEEDEEAAVRSD